MPSKVLVKTNEAPASMISKLFVKTNEAPDLTCLTKRHSPIAVDESLNLPTYAPTIDPMHFTVYYRSHASDLVTHDTGYYRSRPSDLVTQDTRYYRSRPSDLVTKDTGYYRSRPSDLVTQDTGYYRSVRSCNAGYRMLS